MASRRQLRRGLVMCVALGGLAVQGCIAVPVHRAGAPRPVPAYGYGGSGFYSEVNPREAQRECVRAARDFRGYRGVRVDDVQVTGPETARVELRARTFGGYRALGCNYDARTGRAYVR
jgi:hypothetical protein